MAAKAKAGKVDPYIRRKAEDLTQNLRSKDGAGEVHALFEFVRDRVRYLRDIVGVERVADARQTLDVGQGDCDDKAVLLASLLLSIGRSARFKALGFRAGDLSHVLVQTPLGRSSDGRPQWISLDATENHRMGWSPPGVVNSMIHYV